MPQITEQAGRREDKWGCYDAGSEVVYPDAKDLSAGCGIRGTSDRTVSNSPELL